MFVVGELWSVLRRNAGGVGLVPTAMLAAGFILALGTEIVVDLSGA